LSGVAGSAAAIAGTPDAATQPGLDPSNFWFSSYSQGLGIMSAGQWDLEANLYGIGSHFTGLASPAAAGGGLQSGQLSVRHQISGVPGLDLGLVAGGSDLAQSTVDGNLQTRSASAFLTAHYAAKLYRDLGAGMYLQIGDSGQKSGDASFSTTTMVTLTPVLAWEPDGSFIDSLAFNPVTATFVRSGGLSQGPVVSNLIGLGANIAVAMNVTANSVLMPEFSYVHSHGSASEFGGQAASSGSYRVGLVDTISYLGHGSSGRQTNSISIGVWYTQENGAISGPSLRDSASGSFVTRAIIIGATFGCRRIGLNICGGL
jgi:hypothetical protein